MSWKFRTVAASLSLSPLLLGVVTATPEQAGAQTMTNKLWVAPIPPPVDPLPPLNDGDAYIHNNLTVNGTTNIKGLKSDSLTVTGATTTNGITNTGNVKTDTLTVTKDASVAGNLGVTGATTTNGITNTGDITNSGNTKTNTLTVSQDATVSGTLGVAGTATTNGIVNTGNTKTTTLNVTGASTTAGITNTGNVKTDTLTVSKGATVAGTLGVTGATTTNGITNTGDLNNTGAINTKSLIVNGVAITGDGVRNCTEIDSSLCMGKNAAATGPDAIAIGHQANAVEGGTAVGAKSDAFGVQATAIGFGARAGDPGTAVGALSAATGRDATALGYRATASGDQSVALGTGSLASFSRSVAIGPGATTTAPNQVVIGTPGSSLNLPGVASGGKFVGSANQSGPTRLLSTDGQGNIGTSSFDPGRIKSSIQALGQAVNSTGAIASAMSAVPQVVAADNEVMRCGSGVGGYGSSYAASLGCAVKLNPNSPLHINAAIALASSVDYGLGSTPGYSGRLGFSFPLGPRRASAASQAQAQLDELNRLRAEVQQIQAAGTAISQAQASELNRLRAELQQLQLQLARNNASASRPAAGSSTRTR